MPGEESPRYALGRSEVPQEARHGFPTLMDAVHRHVKRTLACRNK